MKHEHGSINTLRALVLLTGVALTDGLGGEEEVAWGERVGGGTVGGHGEQSGGREGGGRGIRGCEGSDEARWP